LIDPELAADAKAVGSVDAFVVREASGEFRQVIYINSRSAVMQRAMRGQTIDLAILAAVIGHEQEHLRGATEPEARRAERLLFQRMITAGLVPTDDGLRHLRDLAVYERGPDALEVPSPRAATARAGGDAGYARNSRCCESSATVASSEKRVDGFAERVPQRAADLWVRASLNSENGFNNSSFRRKRVRRRSPRANRA
jgi:hypothetical protein